MRSLLDAGVDDLTDAVDIQLAILTQEGFAPTSNDVAAAETWKLVASGKVTVGMAVERRNHINETDDQYKPFPDDPDEWGEGYVTSLEPLKVTYTLTSGPSAMGYGWGEVRLLSPGAADSGQTQANPISL